MAKRKSLTPSEGLHSRRVPIKHLSTDTVRNICFVIMPFGGWSDDYFSSIYHPAITEAGLKAHRADDLFRPSAIVSDIWAFIKISKVLLADLTAKNPNVFYELGLAHALAKPVVLVSIRLMTFHLI